ncbi:MAG: hypothetical protein EZS28_006340, partial [Streblomastix strix]
MNSFIDPSPDIIDQQQQQYQQQQTTYQLDSNNNSNRPSPYSPKYQPQQSSLSTSLQLFSQSKGSLNQINTNLNQNQNQNQKQIQQINKQPSITNHNQFSNQIEQVAIMGVSQINIQLLMPVLSFGKSVHMMVPVSAAGKYTAKAIGDTMDFWKRGGVSKVQQSHFQYMQVEERERIKLRLINRRREKINKLQKQLKEMKKFGNSKENEIRQKQIELENQIYLLRELMKARGNMHFKLDTDDENLFQLLGLEDEEYPELNMFSLGELNEVFLDDDVLSYDELRIGQFKEQNENIPADNYQYSVRSIEIIQPKILSQNQMNSNIYARISQQSLQIANQQPSPLKRLRPLKQAAFSTSITNDQQNNFRNIDDDHNFNNSNDEDEEDDEDQSSSKESNDYDQDNYEQSQLIGEDDDEEDEDDEQNRLNGTQKPQKVDQYALGKKLKRQQSTSMMFKTMKGGKPLLIKWVKDKSKAIQKKNKENLRKQQTQEQNMSNQILQRRRIRRIRRIISGNSSPFGFGFGIDDALNDDYFYDNYQNSNYNNNGKKKDKYIGGYEDEFEEYDVEQYDQDKDITSIIHVELKLIPIFPNRFGILPSLKLKKYLTVSELLQLYKEKNSVMYLKGYESQLINKKQLEALIQGNELVKTTQAIIVARDKANNNKQIREKSPKKIGKQKSDQQNNQFSLNSPQKSFLQQQSSSPRNPNQYQSSLSNSQQQIQDLQQQQQQVQQQLNSLSSYMNISSPVRQGYHPSMPGSWTGSWANNKSIQEQLNQLEIEKEKDKQIENERLKEKMMSQQQLQQQQRNQIQQQQYQYPDHDEYSELNQNQQLQQQQQEDQDNQILYEVETNTAPLYRPVRVQLLVFWAEANAKVEHPYVNQQDLLMKETQQEPAQVDEEKEKEKQIKRLQPKMMPEYSEYGIDKMRPPNPAIGMFFLSKRDEISRQQIIQQELEGKKLFSEKTERLRVKREEEEKVRKKLKAKKLPERIIVRARTTDSKSEVIETQPASFNVQADKDSITGFTRDETRGYFFEELSLITDSRSPLIVSLISQDPVDENELRNRQSFAQNLNLPLLASTSQFFYELSLTTFAIPVQEAAERSGEIYLVRFVDEERGFAVSVGLCVHHMKMVRSQADRKKTISANLFMNDSEDNEGYPSVQQSPTKPLTQFILRNPPLLKQFNQTKFIWQGEYFWRNYLQYFGEPGIGDEVKKPNESSPLISGANDAPIVAKEIKEGEFELNQQQSFQLNSQPLQSPIQKPRSPSPTHINTMTVTTSTGKKIDIREKRLKRIDPSYLPPIDKFSLILPASEVAYLKHPFEATILPNENLPVEDQLEEIDEMLDADDGIQTEELDVNDDKWVDDLIQQTPPPLHSAQSMIKYPELAAEQERWELQQQQQALQQQFTGEQQLSGEQIGEDQQQQPGEQGLQFFDQQTSQLDEDIKNMQNQPKQRKKKQQKEEIKSLKEHHTIEAIPGAPSTSTYVQQQIDFILQKEQEREKQRLALLQEQKEKIEREKLIDELQLQQQQQQLLQQQKQQLNMITEQLEEEESNIAYEEEILMPEQPLLPQEPIKINLKRLFTRTQTDLEFEQLNQLNAKTRKNIINIAAHVNRRPQVDVTRGFSFPSTPSIPLPPFQYLSSQENDIIDISFVNKDQQTASVDTFFDPRIYFEGHPAIICEFYTPILKNDQKDQQDALDYGNVDFQFNQGTKQLHSVGSGIIAQLGQDIVEDDSSKQKPPFLSMKGVAIVFLADEESRLYQEQQATGNFCRMYLTCPSVPLNSYDLNIYANIRIDIKLYPIKGMSRRTKSELRNRDADNVIDEFGEEEEDEGIVQWIEDEENSCYSSNVDEPIQQYLSKLDAEIEALKEQQKKRIKEIEDEMQRQQQEKENERLRSEE